MWGHVCQFWRHIWECFAGGIGTRVLLQICSYLLFVNTNLQTCFETAQKIRMVKNRIWHQEKGGGQDFQSWKDQSDWESFHHGKFDAIFETLRHCFWNINSFQNFNRGQLHPHLCCRLSLFVRKDTIESAERWVREIKSMADAGSLPRSYVLCDRNCCFCAGGELFKSITRECRWEVHLAKKTSISSDFSSHLCFRKIEREHKDKKFVLRAACMWLCRSTRILLGEGCER